MIKENDPFPPFELTDEAGQPVTQESFQGKTTVLFFYPKDMTSGCTTEACSLRDDYPTFQASNVQIFGISPDSAESHQQFIAKHQLPYSLLVDEDHKLAEALGVWVEKSMYGRKYMGIERSTFVIGPDLRILKIFRKVKPADHSAELQELLCS